MRLTPVGKLAIFLVVVGLVVGGYRLFARTEQGAKVLPGILGGKADKPSEVPKVADLPDAPDDTAAAGDTTGGGSVVPVVNTMPGTDPGCTDKPEVRMLLWAWNSQIGLMYANGAPQAAKGSLMCGQGVNLKLIRQDDPTKMQEALVAFATALSRGEKNPKDGAHFVAIMGDGGAAFLKGLNDTLRKLGPEYTAKVVGTAGYSRGEDKFMGPPAWKNNPQAAMGGVVSGYLRDGDWNIAQKWLADNGLKNNPDEKTYDPDALNWVSTNDYIDAAEKYVTGYTEERPVVRNGKPTGQKKRITVQGVVTWTPGDVTVAQKKGGLVSIASTKEYSGQMPNIIIGIDKWMKDNRPLVEGYLTALYQANAQVKASQQALNRGAEVSAAVYNEEDAAYWAKYYRGVTEKDRQGLDVELGGSSVNTIRDAQLTFGMLPNTANLFAATYTAFGNVVKQQYPEILPTFDPVDRILDTSYLKNVATRVKAPAQVAAATSVVPTFPKAPTAGASAPRKGPELSRRQWNIQFATGRAVFSPASSQQLNRLLQDLLIAQNTVVEVHGHTDNVGNADANYRLSEERAFAVKNWLQKKAPVNFPQNRVRVYAHGQTQPVASNATDAGRAKNRRVEIVLVAN